MEYYFEKTVFVPSFKILGKSSPLPPHHHRRHKEIQSTYYYSRRSFLFLFLNVKTYKQHDCSLGFQNILILYSYNVCHSNMYPQSMFLWGWWKSTPQFKLCLPSSLISLISCLDKLVDDDPTPKMSESLCFGACCNPVTGRCAGAVLRLCSIGSKWGVTDCYR